MFSVTILEKSVNLVSAFSEKFKDSKKDLSIRPIVYSKPTALALMGAASFCAGVQRKRYSGQQESAPSNPPKTLIK